MTAIQALSGNLPSLPLMTLERKRFVPPGARLAPGIDPGKDVTYDLPDLVSDVAGFVVPESTHPIEYFTPLDEAMPILGAVAGQLSLPFKKTTKQAAKKIDSGLSISDMDKDGFKHVTGEWGERLSYRPKNADFPGEYGSPTRGELYYAHVPEGRRRQGVGGDMARMALEDMQAGGMETVVLSRVTKEGEALARSLEKNGLIGPPIKTTPNLDRVTPSDWHNVGQGKTEHRILPRDTGAEKGAGKFNFNFNERAAMQGLDPKRPWYHGSLKAWEGDYFDPSMGGEAYYGRGIYLTDSPEDAAGYANILHGDNRAKMSALYDNIEEGYRNLPDMIYADFEEDDLVEILNRHYSSEEVMSAYDSGDLMDLFVKSGPDPQKALDELVERQIADSGFGQQHATVQKLLARMDDMKVLDHNNDIFEGDDLERLIQVIKNKSDEYQVDPMSHHDWMVDLMDDPSVTAYDLLQIFDKPGGLLDEVSMSPISDPDLGPFPSDFFQGIWADMGYDAVEMDPGITFARGNKAAQNKDPRNPNKLPASAPGAQHMIIFQKTVEDVTKRDPVKGIFAKLDPDKQYSRNLMAGFGGVAVGLDALTKAQRDKNQQ
tara:strand:- start:9549 stop:11351 length:1803 start_codon:yes stop_codon:yes gene_type:complete